MMTLDDKLIEALIQKKKLSERERDRILRLQQNSSKPFTQLLIDEKICDEEEIVHLLSDLLNIPILRLDSYQIERDVLQLIPRELVERCGVIPVARIGSLLTVAVARPLDLITMDDLKELTQCDIRLVLAYPKAIQNALTSYYAGTGSFKEIVEEAGPEQLELLSAEEEPTRDQTSVDEAPIVRMLNLVVQEAVRERASDIHLEPYADHFRIRYRIDGTLKEAMRQSLEIFPGVIARLKILSNLDITEKKIPQDGRFKIQAGGREIDFRVSLLPTLFGEKGVLRLLDKTNIRSGLDQLGFSEKPISLLKEAIRHPYGMILVTGPTGSGKSTTLYSILNILNTPERNLMSIEDPIEYQVEGITQTQVNPEVGLTFASGLRSLLRQSPDVILVGEIRDAETADIAVKAALTGHLVFSTLHTNSAAGTMTRLIDMGVEPFLIASSVIAVAAQRLLRGICPYCKMPSTVAPEVLKRVSYHSSTTLKDVTAYKGKGCRRCNETGYLGRLGAMEVLSVDTEIRNAILKKASSASIEKMARSKGMETLFENTLGLFKSGKTTLEEVLRVAAEEE